MRGDTHGNLMPEFERALWGMKRMHFTNSVAKSAFCAVLMPVVAISQASPQPGQNPPNRPSDPLASDLARVHKIPIHEHARSAAEREQETVIVERLNRANERPVVDALIAAVRVAKSDSEVVDYRALLPKLPRLKDPILRRISAEQDPMLKGRLVICVENAIRAIG
jgi:hypothetical protein